MEQNIISISVANKLAVPEKGAPAVCCCKREKALPVLEAAAHGPDERSECNLTSNYPLSSVSLRVGPFTSPAFQSSAEKPPCI